jgi:hypothetical protein
VPSLRSNRRHDPSSLDRQHDLDHVPRMRGDQVPVNVASEQRVDMLVADRLCGVVEGDVAQAAHARHQLDAKQPAEAEHGFALTLGVGMQSVRLDLRLILQQPNKDMDRFPDAAWDEAGEERDVVVGDVVVGDAATGAVADALGAKEIVLGQLHVRAVGNGGAAAAPVPGQGGAGVTGRSGRSDGSAEALLDARSYRLIVPSSSSQQRTSSGPPHSPALRGNCGKSSSCLSPMSSAPGLAPMETPVGGLRHASYERSGSTILMWIPVME